ncbi:WD40 repeat domain-containing protein [Kitasatospora sp. NPDC094015]|uniref:WD40 repeat domain-containing protein n=1 Tax=Kitasatospora sp. NPDC094015 TaxID=3155205 RepID=UPI00331BFE29
MNFTTYRHHDDLDTEQHVLAIAELLTPYGLNVNHWVVPEDERDRQAVENRLGDWKRLTATHRGNTVLYWAGHGNAEHLAHHLTPTPIDDGVSPEEVARAIGRRRFHPDSEHSWTIVVLDACFSQDFARKVHTTLINEYRGVDRFLLLSTAAEGYAELGAFTRALENALTITFFGRRAIGLAELGSQLARELRGYRADTVDDHRDQLVRVLPDVASAVSAPLDQLAELQAVIDQLPADEQRHFLPKASGAELGELAWYFHGRTQERDQILHWLATAIRGALVVTGPAGSGKSALLGHVLLHTNTRLRVLLLRHGHLAPLPADIPCPDDPFDLVVHLSGLTLARTLHLVAQAAGLPDLAQEATASQPPADLAARLLERLQDRRERLTLLFDALDEAEQPHTIADTLLRHLAALPAVRIVIGTRRSTREGPDQLALNDTDILDALRPRAHGAHLQYIEVTQNQDALAGYLSAKLHTAQYRGALDADDMTIENAIHRLVTHHQLGGAEPQQFLYVRLAAHELLNDPALLADPSPLIGRTHRQLFTRALERLHRADPHYTPLLHALGLAQGRGMPDQDGIWAQAADALTTTVGTGGSISGLVRDAAPYLVLDQEHGQSVYRLAHRTFSEHFTAAPDVPTAHAAVTTALACHIRYNLDTSPHEDFSPYIRHHLADHARLGHKAGALRILAEHPDVLDTLDLSSITTNALHRGLASGELPPTIAGTVFFHNHVYETGPYQQDHGTIGWRRWWRRLGTAYIQGTPPSVETCPHNPSTWPPTLVAGAVKRRQLHLQLTGHVGYVHSVAAFTAPDGTPRLATTSDDRTVRIWNPATGTQDGPPLTGHTRGVLAVAAFTATDGTPRLATAGYDRTVRIWNPATGTQDGPPLTGHAAGVHSVAAFTATDGTPRLATTSDDRTIRIWNPATGTQDGPPLTGHTRGVLAVAAFTATDGTPRLASASDDKTVRIWNPATGTQDGPPLTGHAAGVHSVAAFTAPDGTPRLASASDDKTVRIWNPATGTQDGRPLTDHTDWVRSVAAFTAPDGTPRLASASYDKTVRVWNPATSTQEGQPLVGHTNWVRVVRAFTAADGTPRLASAGDDQTVRIWNPATSTQEGQPLVDRTGRVRVVGAFTAADGTPRLATTGNDRTVRIWNPATGTPDGPPLIGHTGRVRVVGAFTAADGTPRLASAGRDKTVRVWNPATGTQEGQPLVGHTNWVRVVRAFTAADGTPRLASAGDDQTVRIWNPATGTQDGPALTGHTDGVLAVGAFVSPDGTPRLASAGYDRTVRIWNPATGTQDGPPLTGHTRAIMTVASFTAPDGTPRLATTGDDTTVRIWNPATGAQDGPALTGHNGGVQVVAFTVADGTPRLATTGDDKTVRIWNPATGTTHMLPLEDQIYALTEHCGLIIAGTDSGYLAIDISSIPAGTV